MSQTPTHETHVIVGDHTPEPRHVFTIQHWMPTSEQMRAELQRKLDAGEPLGAWHVPDEGLAIVANGSVEPPDHLRYAMMTPSDKPKWPCRGEIVRKHVSEKYCGGVTCMPGLSGKCVACADEE